MDKKILILCLIFAFIALSVCSSCKKNILERKFNRAERSLIVKTHNKLRKSLEKGEIREQPRALKLRRLKWDARLAKQAQKVADTCKFKHVRVKDDRWSVGQNLHELSSTAYQKSLNLTQAIYYWFNEYKFYKFPYYSKASGHYTQVIWANTRYVGCGYTHFKTKGKYKYHKLLVCNYGPAGNVQGFAPYKPWSKE